MVVPATTRRTRRWPFLPVLGSFSVVISTPSCRVPSQVLGEQAGQEGARPTDVELTDRQLDLRVRPNRLGVGELERRAEPGLEARLGLRIVRVRGFHGAPQ